jgi:hypothetical protein
MKQEREISAGLELRELLGRHDVEHLDPTALLSVLCRRSRGRRLRHYFGPSQLVFQSLGEAGARQFREELKAAFESYDLATDATMKLDCEHVEVVAIRA